MARAGRVVVPFLHLGDEQRESPAQGYDELGGAQSSELQIADGLGDGPLERHAEDAALAEALRSQERAAGVFEELP
jgi:hypothetical protein